jgi:hypothetical protein
MSVRCIVNFFETAIYVLPYTFAIAIVVPSSLAIFPLKLKKWYTHDAVHHK